MISLRLRKRRRRHDKPLDRAVALGTETSEAEIRDGGALFRTDQRDCSSLADAMAWQAEAVTSVLPSWGIEPLPAVMPDGSPAGAVDVGLAC